MKEISAVKNLAQIANLMATLNGGIVGSKKKLLKFQDCLKLEVHLPGIRANAVKAEIKGNRLIVQYLVDVNSSNLRARISNIVYNKPIPYFVDIASLTTKFTKGKLEITMPFNQLGNGYNRQLDISQ